ncbi:MAG: ribonuclease P protein component [Bacteroidota bacterium]
MGQSKYSFSKKERLSGKKKIEELFKMGSSFYLNTFQVRYFRSKDEVNYHKVLISVPKKNFKRAVDRNLLKRRIREAYRLNKYRIENIKPLSIGFVYISKHIITFQEIQDQLIQCLQRLK